MNAQQTPAAGVADAVQSRPWNPQDGPEPTVWCWPYGTEPALYVRAGGRWRWATVRARQDHADGRTVYQVDVDVDGSDGVRMLSYTWPQPGLRVAHPGRAQPTRDRGRR